MKLVLDLSSYAWRCLLAGQDEEHGYFDSEGKYINSSQYGWDNLAGSLKKVFELTDASPKDLIVVKDGIHSKQLRQSFSPDYKATRHKSSEQYQQFNHLVQMACEDLKHLGAQIVEQDGMEADDIIMWLCQNLRQDNLIVLTHDKDLLACAQYGHVKVYIQEQANPKLFGECPFDLIDVYKATVGDPSDNISGAKGFGKAAFEKVHQRFGDNGLRVLRELITKRRLVDLQEDVAQVPQLQKLIDYAPDVEASLKCAQFYTHYVKMGELKWQHGLCRPDQTVHPLLSDFSAKVTGVTSDNFNQVFDAIRIQADGTQLIALDIETTTPEISDEWLYEIKQQESKTVDTFGSELTGISLTLGNNLQHTYYFAVDHADTQNCTLAQIESVLKYLDASHRFIIHNTNFELVVLHNTFGWFLRDVDDTKLMASYVDENGSLGLKPNSARWLDYKQATYEDTVGDRKMNQLSLQEVLHYGADDTICTAALYQWFQIHMMLENVWQTYRDVEIGAAYWIAQAFLDGVDISQTTLRDMIKRDEQAKSQHMMVLDKYLIEQGWQGSQFEFANADTYLQPTWIKYAFEICTGRALGTRVRKFDRLIEAIIEQGEPNLATALQSHDVELINRYVQSKFLASPAFNTGSVVQMQKLLYDVMALPIRLRNKPTDKMRLLGQQGSPQTDELAIQSALHYDLPNADDPRRAVLESLLKIKTYNTREGLYYKTYPRLPHWKDGKIHASNNQCSTVTRRFSCSKPNLAQLSKGAGDFRKIFVPHHKDALIVSLDFSAQELRLTAHASQDPNMLACYIGDNLRDMHSITGSSIAGRDYNEFVAIVQDENHPEHKAMKANRAIGKTVNFGELYGAQAKTMSQTMMCSEEEAQHYIDAKAKAFPVVNQWKAEAERQATERGYSQTLLGARRHLKDLNSLDKWQQARAARQAVNFIIQGSGAEMTKLAMGRMWKKKIRERFDIRFFSPIHDEVVFSVAKADLVQAVLEIHACMTAQYADMVVPVESSVSMGTSFGDQHELNALPTAENLNQLMSKL